MNIIEHAGHIAQFDGTLHWCFLIALAGFLSSLIWVVVRVLLPLRYLARLADAIAEGQAVTFSEPKHGIGEVQRLRSHLSQMMEQIAAAQAREALYRNALTDNQERERMRIAHEIHDDSIQSLVLVSHHIERATQAAKTGSDSLLVHLANARETLIDSVERLRGVIANLRPTVLDELGLVAAVRSLCETQQFNFEVVGEARELDQAQELALFRAAQEAVRNAERHAQAKQIDATLIYTRTDVTLKVCDDGVGFDIPRHLQEFATSGHYGLLGIRERMVQLRGRLDLMSTLGGGTQVAVSFALTHPK